MFQMKGAVWYMKDLDPASHFVRDFLWDLMQWTSGPHLYNSAPLLCQMVVNLKSLQYYKELGTKTMTLGTDENIHLLVCI